MSSLSAGVACDFLFLFGFLTLERHISLCSRGRYITGTERPVAGEILKGAHSNLRWCTSAFGTNLGEFLINPKHNVMNVVHHQGSFNEKALIKLVH